MYEDIVTPFEGTFPDAVSAVIKGMFPLLASQGSHLVITRGVEPCDIVLNQFTADGCVNSKKTFEFQEALKTLGDTVFFWEAHSAPLREDGDKLEGEKVEPPFSTSPTVATATAVSRLMGPHGIRWAMSEHESKDREILVRYDDGTLRRVGGGKPPREFSLLDFTNYSYSQWKLGPSYDMTFGSALDALMAVSEAEARALAIEVFDPSACSCDQLVRVGDRLMQRTFYLETNVPRLAFIDDEILDTKTLRLPATIVRLGAFYQPEH